MRTDDLPHRVLVQVRGVLGRDDWVDHSEALSIYFVDPWHHRFEITTYETARTHALLR
ncbi:MAG: hypothetical protein IIB66_11750 [Proteobacteria bacterium]|nr:hypothetical protein [Pseudomonadota bacterium]